MKNHLIFLIGASLFGIAHASDEVTPSVKTCQEYGDTLVERSGKALAKIGESPVDIRRTVNYYCIKGFHSASEAKSEGEIELWRDASMSELSGINPDRDEYKASVIDVVTKMAHDFYKIKESSNGTGE